MFNDKIFFSTLEIINKHKFKYITLFSFISFSAFIYVDYLAFLSIGKYISYILFLFIILLSLYKLSYGIVFTLFLSIFISEFPRDILNLYSDIQVSKTTEYNVLSTIVVFKFTLLNILFIFNSSLAFIKIIKVRIKPINFLIFIYVGLGLISLLYSLMFHENTLTKAILTDLKFPLFLVFGFIQGIYLYRTNSLHLILLMIFLLPIFSGIRVLFFIINDIYTISPKFYFMTPSMISLIVLSYLILTKNNVVYKSFIFRLPLYMSMIEPSRGFIVMSAIFITLSLLLSFLNKKNGILNYKILLEFFLIFFSTLGILILYNPNVYGFLIWKLNVFMELLDATHDMSGSGKVRIYELLNVYRENMNSFYQYFFGKGFGGTYSFDYFPMYDVEALDLKSFSNDQLQTGIYYSTHSFSSYMLLKYGLVGLFVYLLFPLKIIADSFKNIKNSNLHIIILLFTILSIYSYYWRLEIAILIGIFFTFYNELRRNNRNEL